MTDKFAPGPWELVVNEKITIDTVDIATIYGTPSQPTEDGKGQRWLHVVGKRDNRDQEFSDIQMANAILISAAPDMYYELCDLYEYFDQRSDISDATTDSGQPLPNAEMQIATRLNELLDKIDESIARARGES